jgi:tight adherence protein C
VSASSVGALVGLMGGLGLLLVVSRLPLLRKPGLDERLALYVGERARPSGLLAPLHGGRKSLVRELLAPLAARLAGDVERVLGGAASVRRRLVRAGREPDVEGFRAEQVLWGAAGLLVGGWAAAALWWRGSPAPLPLVVLVLVCGAVGVAARDWYLTRQADRRERRMLAEFPTVAEMLALAVGAGEGPVAALDRVTRISGGELSAELLTALADVRAGAPLVVALQRLSDRTALTTLTRFVDGFVVAVERGTPLAEVLRAQAQDVREAGQRALMDSAGRKEIAMMGPVAIQAFC